MMTTNLWIAIAAILAVAFVVLWWPYLRNSKLQANEVNSRSQANTESYQQSLLKLQQQRDDKQITQADFDTLSTELGRKLLQDEASQEIQLSVGKRTIAWPIIASLLTVTLTIPLYLKLGASDQLDAPVQAANDDPHANLTQEQQLEMVLQQMEQQVAQNPTDSQSLFRLAHAYTSAGKFDQAITAFKQLVELEGEHAEFIGPQAQALYYKNQQQMTPEVIALIDRALKLDPEDTSTLVLLGMDNFVNSNYADAITTWQRVLNSNRPGIDRLALENAIGEAKQRLTLTGEELPNMPAAPVTASLKVKVDISDELKGQFTKDQIVFIYAIPVEGSRMPLAAVKITAGELPTQVILDDSMAMTPAAKISDYQNVKLFAIISKSGTPGIKPGDLQGFVESASLDSEHPYLLTIDSIAK
ncbi:MAG: c-type cytochrome biogenesis protein CcmI [Gammaproteobacteria bacterium]|nr:c-type cytochrome biogenesis protein CcmI [Gammaproteobacteria bacterium]